MTHLYCLDRQQNGRRVRLLWRTRYNHSSIMKLYSSTKRFVIQLDTTEWISVQKAKPTGSKGSYMTKISLSSTMGAGVTIDIAAATAR